MAPLAPLIALLLLAATAAAGEARVVVQDARAVVAAATPDGRWAVAWDREGYLAGSVHVLDRKRRLVAATLRLSGTARELAIDTEGARVAVALDDRIEILDARTGRVRQTIPRATGAVAFSGGRIAVHGPFAIGDGESFEPSRFGARFRVGVYDLAARTWTAWCDSPAVTRPAVAFTKAGAVVAGGRGGNPWHMLAWSFPLHVVFDPATKKRSVVEGPVTGVNRPPPDRTYTPHPALPPAPEEPPAFARLRVDQLTPPAVRARSDGVAFRVERWTRDERGHRRRPVWFAVTRAGVAALEGAPDGAERPAVRGTEVYSRDRTLVAAQSEGAVVVRDTATGAVRARLPFGPGKAYWFRPLGVDAARGTVLLGHGDHRRAMLVRLADGKELLRTPEDAPPEIRWLERGFPLADGAWLVAHGRHVRRLGADGRWGYSVSCLEARALAPLPDGRALLRADEEQVVIDVATGAVRERVAAEGEAALAFDARFLVRARGVPHAIEFVDARTLEVRLTIHPLDGGRWVAFTPDGRWDAAPGAETKVAVLVDGEAVADRDERRAPGLVAKTLRPD